MKASQWFVQRDTYEREIEHPETKEKATVTMRPLNAGDRAELQELRLVEGEDGEGEGRIHIARQQLHAVRLALAAWSIDTPITADTIAQLDPRVFDQIYKHVSFGNPSEVVDAEAREDEANLAPLPRPALAERGSAAAAS